MFKGFSHSERGASHDKKGTVCQDSSLFGVRERYAVAVVADGHGSKKHFRSDIGSKCAVEAGLETIDRFYEDAEAFEKNFPRNRKSILNNIGKQIISNWNTKITEHFKKNPVTDKEKEPFTADEFEAIPFESYYGTTLILAVMSPLFTFGLQIGDGSLVTVLADGRAVMPLGYEEDNPANITASMCNANAASMFDTFYFNGTRKVAAIYTSTDGLYTSFGNEYDFLDYHSIITSQMTDLESFKETVFRNMAKRTHYGTEDDISLSCVVNNEVLEENLAKINETIAKNKQRAQERKAKMLAKN